MHSSRMRTAHLLTVSRNIPLGGRGVCLQGGLPPGRVCIHGGLHPGEGWAHSSSRSAYRAGRPRPPGCRPPGHVNCDACWQANPTVDRQTSENITLPLTSFEGGNYQWWWPKRNYIYPVTKSIVQSR